MNSKKTKIVPWMTITVFVLYMLTDTAELIQSGFSVIQLTVTYIAMAGIPFAVMGLYRLDDEKGGLLYLLGAFLISWSFIYFAGTATYALAENETDYGLLVERLGIVYKLHGVLLVIGGFLFAAVLIIKKICHPAIAVSLVLASLTSLITGLLGLSELGFVIGNYLRNAAFVALAIEKLKR